MFASSGFVFIGCASPLSCRNACGARAGGFRRRSFFCARFLFVPRARSSCAQQRGNAECAWRKREFVVPVSKINMVEKRRERNSARAAQVRAAVGWGGGRAARPPPSKRPRGPPGQAFAGGGLRPPSPRASPPPLGVRGLRRATRHRHCAHPCVRQREPWAARRKGCNT